MILSEQESSIVEGQDNSTVDIIAIGEAIHETEDLMVDVVIFSNERIYIGSNIADNAEYDKTTGVIGQYKSIDDLNADGWITTITNLMRPVLEVKVKKEHMQMIYLFNTYDVFITHEMDVNRVRYVAIDQGDMMIAKIPLEEIRDIEWKNLAPSFIKMYNDIGVLPLYTISISHI